MNVLRRCYVVVFLWLATLILALVTSSTESGGRNVFLNLSYLFGALLVLSFLWARLSLLGVCITRFLRANRSQVGKYVEEELTVENTGPLPKLWLEIRDRSELPGHRLSRVVSALSAHHQRSWHVRTPCVRRGRFQLGPITLFSGDPFGLFVFQRQMNLLASVVIYPPTFELTGFSPPVGQIAGGEALRRRTHQITSNVSGVRDYSPGDSYGRIHWPSTARTGRLIVKEFELDPLADVWLFLDMERHSHVGSLRTTIPDAYMPSVLRLAQEKPGPVELDPSTEEYAVAAAASLAKHFLDRGWSLGMITYPNRQKRELAQADRGERQRDRILSILAVTHARGSIPLAQILTAESVYLSRNVLAIVVTPDVNSEWIAALRHLSTRGARTTAILIDASTFTPQGADVASVNRAVADLVSSRIPTYRIGQGDSLQAALSQPTSYV